MDGLRTEPQQRGVPNRLIPPILVLLSDRPRLRPRRQFGLPGLFGVFTATAMLCTVRSRFAPGRRGPDAEDSGGSSDSPNAIWSLPDSFSAAPTTSLDAFAEQRSGNIPWS